MSVWLYSLLQLQIRIPKKKVKKQIYFGSWAMAHFSNFQGTILLRFPTRMKEGILSYLKICFPKYIFNYFALENSDNEEVSLINSHVSAFYSEDPISLTSFLLCNPIFVLPPPPALPLKRLTEPKSPASQGSRR